MNKLAIILALCGSVAIAGCGLGNQLTIGTIVAKEHHNPSTSLGVTPVFGGKQTSFALTNDSEPERWIFVIRGSHNGESREERIYADRYDWEKANVGDTWSKP